MSDEFISIPTAAKIEHVSTTTMYKKVLKEFQLKNDNVKIEKHGKHNRYKVKRSFLTVKENVKGDNSILKLVEVLKEEIVFLKEQLADANRRTEQSQILHQTTQKQLLMLQAPKQSFFTKLFNKKEK